jgi:hypothetical protein
MGGNNGRPFIKKMDRANGSNMHSSFRVRDPHCAVLDDPAHRALALIRKPENGNADQKSMINSNSCNHIPILSIPDQAAAARNIPHDRISLGTLGTEGLCMRPHYFEQLGRIRDDGESLICSRTFRYNLLPRIRRRAPCNFVTSCIESHCE